MTKKYIEKTIVDMTSEKPIPWKDVKHVEFEDGDVITAGHDEGFYEENNSMPSHYFFRATRMVEETDKEYHARIILETKARLFNEERQWETYLKLKEKFKDRESK
jgi:hypothetical protein